MNLTRQISKTTNLDDAVLIERILAVLDEDKYGIKKLTTDYVEFNHHNGGMRWNFEYMKLLDSGEFTVDRFGNKKVVNLKYLGIPLSEIVFVAVAFLFFVIISITNQVYFFCFFVSIVFPGQLIFKYFNLKSKAGKMLEKILHE